MLEAVYLTRSKIRRHLLGIVFSNPSRQYYLSELARSAGTSAGNVQRELSRFVRDRLITREKKGNLVFFVINTRHALYPEIRSLILKTIGIEGVLRNLLQKFKQIRLALIYGSFARGEEKGESDIDLMIVADGTLEKFYAALSKLESRFNREINTTAYSAAELKDKIRSKDTFVNEVLHRPKIILKGELNEFQKQTSRKS